MICPTTTKGSDLTPNALCQCLYIRTSSHLPPYLPTKPAKHTQIIYSDQLLVAQEVALGFTVIDDSYGTSRRIDTWDCAVW